MIRVLSTIVAFAGKEIREVIRQPRLMAVLILGPFAILGLFAIGYRPEPPPLRTVLVLPDGAVLGDRVQEMQESMSAAVEIVDVTPDEAAATRSLRNGEVDLVIVAPADAFETVQNDEQARLLVLHDKLDPFDRAYINIFSRASTDELNRRVLEEVAGEAQSRAAEYQEALPLARESAADLTEAIRRRDEAGAVRAQFAVDRQLDTVQRGLGDSGDFLEALDRSLGSDSDSISADVRATRDQATAIDVSSPDALSDAEELEASLAELDEVVGTFRRISPGVLVQPFIADTKTIEGDIPLTTYYSPAVLIVLLQHVVLTFAALSIVRERSLGTTELFRVGPMNVWQVLFGKFIGYALIGVVVGAILTVGVVFGFGTPMNGSWLWLAGVMALTMTASLGLGFLIAALAGTDAQAVQFAMLALLFTIFFSGLVVSLTRLAPGVQQAAFAVPATAGTAALQDVMFRGVAPSPLWLGILAAYTVVAFVLARWRLRVRQIA